MTCVRVGCNDVMYSWIYLVDIQELEIMTVKIRISILVLTVHQYYWMSWCISKHTGQPSRAFDAKGVFVFENKSVNAKLEFRFSIYIDCINIASHNFLVFIFRALILIAGFIIFYVKN